MAAPRPSQPAQETGSQQAETEANRQELPQATARRQEELLDRLRDRKGSSYTEALAGVIPQLSGAVRTKARDALAERWRA